jgi:hypothetical protein
MKDAQEPNPDPPSRYVLTWPASMAGDVARAANAHTMPMAVWIREAIREKLERTPPASRPEGGQP